MESENVTKHFAICRSSEGLCFICLRDAAIVDLGNDSDLDLPEARLRNITRFLGINLKKILQSHFTSELRRREGVQVKLCQGCSELMEKFDSLYGSLELTRLRLNDCVRRIHSLIDEAERDNVRVDKMKRRVTHVPTAGVLNELRRKVLEKSSRVMEAALPQVVVKRMASAEVARKDTVGLDSTNKVEEEVAAGPDSVHDEEPSDEDDQVSLPEAPKSSRKSMRRGMCRQVSDSEEWKPPSFKRKVKRVNGTRTTRLPCQDQRKNFTCSHCGARCKDKKSLQFHTAQYHIHQYFLEQRLPSVSSELFENIASNALFEFMIERKGRMGRCAVCSKQLLFDKGKYVFLRMHLVRSHYEDLVKKLVELQTDPGILNLDGLPLEKAKEASSSLSKFSCPHCKAVSGSLQKLNLHLVNHHFETFFAPEEKFKDTSLSSHQYKQTIHHLLFNESYVGCKVERKKCPECVRPFNGRNWLSHLKVHMIQKHFADLTRRLSKLQKDPTIQQMLDGVSSAAMCKCGAYYLNMRAYRQHQLNYCQLLQRLSYQVGNNKGSKKKISSSRKSSKANKRSFYEKPCPHCRAVIVMKRSNDISWNLDLHLLSHHLDTYFVPEDKFKKPSLSSYQFKQVLGHFLFEFIGTSGKPGGTQYCPICPHTLKSSSNRGMKLHLIKNHPKELTQRLRELQNDPDLLDKLKGTKGFSCKCGAYFESMTAGTAHQKKFCNLLSGTISAMEGKTKTTGNIPDVSTRLEVDDDDREDEDESCVLIPHDSAPEHGRDPLALKHESGQFDDERKPVETDLDQNIEIDVEEFVYVAKVEEEPLEVKTERKRGFPWDSNSTEEEENVESELPKFPKIEITSPTETI